MAMEYLDNACVGETVEIEGCALSAAGRLDTDRGAVPIIALFTEGDDHVETIGATALKDTDQRLLPALR